MTAAGKALLHLAGRVRRVVNAADIYYLEAQGDETDIRFRAARPLRDVRSIAEVLTELGPQVFLRIHRNHAVTRDAFSRSGRPARAGRSYSNRP